MMVIVDVKAVEPKVPHHIIMFNVISSSVFSGYDRPKFETCGILHGWIGCVQQQNGGFCDCKESGAWCLAEGVMGKDNWIQGVSKWVE